MTLKLKIAKFLANHYHMREGDDPCELCLIRAEELLTILNLEGQPKEDPSRE